MGEKHKGITMKPTTIEKIRKVLKRAFALWFVSLVLFLFALIFISGYGVEVPYLDILGFTELGIGAILVILKVIFNWEEIIDLIDN